MTARARQDLISVIISAYNYGPYLADAIQSALGQDWDPLEVIVVDDGSSDDTLAVARRFEPRVAVIAGGHEGPAATRNRGIAVARGAYMLHLDADDLLMPGALRTLMGVFAHDGRCDIAAGHFSCFLSPELSHAVASGLDVPRDPQRGHLAGVAIIRAEVFASVGLLDSRYEPGSDMEWWLRAAGRSVSIRLIDDVVCRRRMHGSNHSLRNSAMRKRLLLRLVREARQQKRMAPE